MATSMRSYTAQDDRGSYLPTWQISAMPIMDTSSVRSSLPAPPAPLSAVRAAVRRAAVAAGAAGAAARASAHLRFGARASEALCV